MTHRNYSLIPVIVAIVLIPQLLFWWLAPAVATARLAVYIGGTLLTIGIPVAYLLTYWNSDLRKSAGLSIVCGTLEIAIIALSALLLGMDVSRRSAVFALTIMVLVCLIVMIPLINATMKQQVQGLYAANVSTEPNNQSASKVQDYSDQTTSIQPHKPIPVRMSQQPTTPLPPRNR